jgi:hypothetical protein
LISRSRGGHPSASIGARLEPEGGASISEEERHAASSRPSLRVRCILSAFILINLGTVLFMNRPPWMVAGWEELRARWLPGRLGQMVRMGELQVRRYAHMTGLDRYWDMFSRLAPMDWRFVLKGEYEDGSVVLLPIERQSERTFLQRHFFDFKEMKYHQNLYPTASAQHREAYLRYLARRFPEHDGSRLWRVRMELHTRPLLDPYEAARAGHHLGKLEVRTYAEYPSRKEAPSEVPWIPSY